MLHILLVTLYSRSNLLMMNELRTKRLVLKDLANDDHEFILKLVNTTGWLNFIGDRKVRSNAAALEYIRQIKNDDRTNYWVVYIQDQTRIGVVTLIKRAHLEHPDIGFAFLPNYQGNGYAYEATKQVLDYQSKQLGLRTILAITMINNNSSIRLIEKLGFSFWRLVNKQGESTIMYQLTLGR